MRGIGSGLLVVAILAPIVRLAAVQSVNWTPVVMTLAAGASERREFGVGHAGAYELGVRIDRPADRERNAAAECALGFDFVECEGTTPVRLRWQLQAHDGRPVRCGPDPAATREVEARSSGGRFTPEFLERWLGCFDAEERVRYSLQVEVISGLEPLQSLHPRFLVLPSSDLDRDQYSLTAAVWMLSLFVGLTGLLLITEAAEPTTSISFSVRRGSHAHDASSPAHRSPVP